MLSLKTDPKGIDKAIQKIQENLHAYLVERWGADYECYGRVYKNLSERGVLAEVYTGSNYKEVFWNSALKAISFFSVGDQVEDLKGMSKVKVGVTFFVDLVKIKPDITHRADEEVRLDVLEFFSGMNYTGYETGLSNVLKEYPGTLESLKTVDMHPAHAFRININLIYQNC